MSATNGQQPQSQIIPLPFACQFQRATADNGEVIVVMTIVVPALALSLSLLLAPEEAVALGNDAREKGSGLTVADELPPWKP